MGGGWGHGHGWGGDGPDGDDGEGWGGGPRWMGGGGRGFILRRLSAELDATPAQEKVMRAAADELQEAASKLRGEGKRTRADLAAALRKGHFDEVLFGELFARHDRSIEDLRKAFIGAGAHLHDALDESQRERLATLVEEGPRAWRRGWGRSDRARA